MRMMLSRDAERGYYEDPQVPMGLIKAHISPHHFTTLPRSSVGLQPTTRLLVLLSSSNALQGEPFTHTQGTYRVRRRVSFSSAFPGAISHFSSWIGPLMRLACVHPFSAVRTAVSVVSKTT